MDRAPLFATLTLLAFGCAAPERRAAPPSDPSLAPEPAGWQGGQLYARDGSAIGAAQAGDASSGTSAAPREIAPSEGGRMYILELYQKAIDDRDALELEVRSLQVELDRVRAAAAKSEVELAAATDKTSALQAENQRLLAENVELAARLTTAQIRRLQVEKLLLESRILELRGADAKSATAQAEGAKQ